MHANASDLTRVSDITTSEALISSWQGAGNEKSALLEHLIALEIENCRLRQELELAAITKEEFLSLVSHELRTPLTAIIGWTQLLLKSALDEREISEGLSIIERNAKEQSRRIDELLDMARLMDGTLTLNLEMTSLAHTITEAVASIRRAVSAKELCISIVTESGSGEVLCDARLMRQAIWQLLSNAVKFNYQGGQIKVALEQWDDQLIITVSDTGVGIDRDFMPRIFEYFTQADNALTRAFGGLGIGLAIVRLIVELHGGTVTIDSPGLEQGTAVFIKLPVHYQPATE